MTAKMTATEVEAGELARTTKDTDDGRGASDGVVRFSERQSKLVCVATVGASKSKVGIWLSASAGFSAVTHPMDRPFARQIENFFA